MVGVAQLVERWIVAPVVEGSSPFTHPNILLRKRPLDSAPLAQLVEQLTLNQRVRSSSLRRRTSVFKGFLYASRALSVL